MLIAVLLFTIQQYVQVSVNIYYVTKVMYKENFYNIYIDDRKH